METITQKWHLSGRRALVTGASLGIGAAVTEELAGLGAEVVAVARRMDPLFEAVAAWQDNGLAVHPMQIDATAAPDQQRLVEWVQRHWGDLDAAVLNVGTNLRKPTLGYSEAEMAHLWEVNFASAIRLARLLHPLLAERQGSLVFVGSVAGEVAIGSGLPYAASKAALAQAARHLAYEWGPQGIRVNVVQPWYTQTALTAPVLEDPAFLAKVEARTPLRRVAQASEVASAIAFLCLPAASYINGAVLSVDGGFLASGW